MAPDPGTQPAAIGAGAPADEEVVARVRGGDRSLFELLMRRHNTRVYRVVRSVLSDEAEAEDAMQQAYLHAYAGLGSYAGRSSFSTWLTRIALNEALARLRARRRLAPVEDLPEEDPMDPAPTPEDQASSREHARLLEQAIDRLPEGHRTVIVLRDLEGLSTAEAAAVLEVSEDAVKVRLHRARRALGAALAGVAAAGAPQAFPFPAARCDRVVAGVLARLGRG